MYTPADSKKGGTMTKIAALALFITTSVFAQNQPPARLVSPEVGADNRVTFRFRDPNAKEVLLSPPIPCSLIFTAIPSPPMVSGSSILTIP